MLHQDTELKNLLEKGQLWRANSGRAKGQKTLGTGYPEFDNALPGQGWPLGAITELLSDQIGVGEWSLVLPALANLSQNKDRIALIAPPHIPYAPALANARIEPSHMLLVHTDKQDEQNWVVEQVLASGCCKAVLFWADRLSQRNLRRLQLAAEKGQSWGILFRSSKQKTQHSPAALRLYIQADETENIQINILKCRGRTAPAQPIHVRRPS